MDDDKETKDLKDVVPEEKETTPNPEVAPPAVAPPNESKTNLEDTVNHIATQVAELTQIVSGVVAKADPDTTPVRRPWTHWGSAK